MIRSRIARWSLRLLGVISVLTALIVAVGGGPAALALGSVAFGSALLTAAWQGPPPPGSLAGVRTVDGGTSFERSRAVVRGVALSLACLGVASATLGLSATGTGDRLRWAAAAAFSLAVAALAYRPLRSGSDVLLTPHAVIQRFLRRDVVVPWAAIERVERLNFGATEILSLHLGDDRTGVRLPAVSRLLRSSDVSVWLNSLRADSRVFVDLVEHMADHPEDRDLLAGPDALSRASAGRDRRTSPSGG